VVVEIVPVVTLIRIHVKKNLVYIVHYYTVLYRTLTVRYRTIKNLVKIYNVDYQYIIKMAVVWHWCLQRISP